MIFGDIAGLPEGIRKDAGIADRILGPIIDACSGVDTDHASLADAELAHLLADAARLTDHLNEASPIALTADSGAAAQRWPYWRNHRADLEIFRRDFVGEPLDVVARRVDARVRIREEEVHPIKFRIIGSSGGG